jgi:hypothetical protein
MAILEEKLLLIDEEFKAQGTISGSPVCRIADGYDEGIIKEFHAQIKEYRTWKTRSLLSTDFLTEYIEEAAILNLNFDALDYPSVGEVEDWRGVIERVFSGGKRRRYSRHNDLASLTRKMDKAERFGHSFVMNTRIFCAHHIIKVSLGSEFHSLETDFNSRSINSFEATKYISALFMSIKVNR